MSDGSCALRLTRRYDAPPHEVWRALTDPGSLERWLSPPPGVEVRTAEPERLLELEWRPPGEAPSIVTLELRSDGDRTILVVDHRRLTATLGMRYVSRWTRVLERFERGEALA